MGNLTFNGQEVEKVMCNGDEVQTVKVGSDTTICASIDNFYDPQYRESWPAIWSADGEIPDINDTSIWMLESSWWSSTWITSYPTGYSTYGPTSSTQAGLTEYSSQNLVVIENPGDNTPIGGCLYYYPKQYYIASNTPWMLWCNFTRMQRFDKNMLCINSLCGNNYPTWFAFYDVMFSSGKSTAVTTQTDNTTSSASTYPKMTRLSQMHYSTGIDYQINGQYSSKVIHMPACEYENSVFLNKYLTCVPFELDDWKTVTYEQVQGDKIGTSSQYAYNAKEKYTYHHVICKYPQKWHPLTGTPTTVQSKTLINISQIISSIDSENKFERQNLTFKSSENTTSDIRYQILGFYTTTDNLEGYQPNYTGDYRGSKFIIIQDPKDDPLVYFGNAPAGVYGNSSRVYANTTPAGNKYSGYYYLAQFQNSPIVYNHYTDDTLENSEVMYDFNPLGFAKSSTIEEWNYTLFDAQVDISMTFENMESSLYYVALPPKWQGYKPVVDINSMPSGWELDEQVYEHAMFNGIDYTLYEYSGKTTSNGYLWPIEGHVDKIYLTLK